MKTCICFDSYLDSNSLNTYRSDRGNLLRWPRDTLYPQMLVLTSPTSGGRSVGIGCSQTKATEFSFSCFSFSEKCFEQNLYRSMKQFFK
jgi:hypothetical protein